MGTEQVVRRSLVKISIGLGLLLGISAVYSSAGTPPNAAGTTSPGSSPAEDIPKPFASLVDVTEDDQHALHDAEELEVAACMKAHGFHYTPLVFKANIQRRQPLGDLAGAQVHGYGIADGFDKGEQPISENDAANDIDTRNLSPFELQAWSKALLGTPPGPADAKDPLKTVEIPDGPVLSIDPASCASKARSAVYGDDLNWQRLQMMITYLQNQVYDNAMLLDAMNDPTFRVAADKWRRCMNERGFDYERPLAAGNALRDAVLNGKLTGASVRTTEIKIATADAECFHNTGMSDIVAAQIKKYETQVINVNKQTLTEFATMQQQAINRAKSILSFGSGR